MIPPYFVNQLKLGIYNQRSMAMSWEAVKKVSYPKTAFGQSGWPLFCEGHMCMC